MGFGTMTVNGSVGFDPEQMKAGSSAGSSAGVKSLIDIEFTYGTDENHQTPCLKAIKKFSDGTTQEQVVFTTVAHSFTD